MAFTVTPITTGNSARSWQIDSALDADAFVDVPHGYPAKPKLAIVAGQSVSDAQCLANSLCGWSVDWAASDATNIRVRKSVAAGSGTGSAILTVPVPVL